MKTKMKRIYAVLLVFLLLIIALVLILLTIIPKLADQLASLASSMPDFFKQVETGFMRLRSYLFLNKLI